MVKNLLCNAGNTGSIPDRGTKIPHAKEQLGQIDKKHNFKEESLKINNVEQDAFVKKKKKVEERQYSPTYTPPPCPGGGSLKDDITPHRM